MKIIDMISIIELDKDDSIPIIPSKSGQHEELLSIYSDNQGIHFYGEQDIGNLVENDKSKIYKLKNEIETNIKEVYNNGRELNKYLAVSELLIAVDEFKGGEGAVDWKKAKDYVNKINKKIRESLVFDDVSDMKDLIDIIKNNKLYREIFFNVREKCCNKDERYQKSEIQKRRCCFGNREYHEKLDVVDIIVYNDWIELTCHAEGKSYEKYLDVKQSYTLEQKILSALDEWRCWFWN